MQIQYVFRVVWGKKQRRKSSPAPDDPGRSAMPPLPHRGRHLQGRPATRRNTPTTTKARTHAKETSPPNQATQEDFENLPTRAAEYQPAAIRANEWEASFCKFRPDFNLCSGGTHSTSVNLRLACLCVPAASKRLAGPVIGECYSFPSAHTFYIPCKLTVWYPKPAPTGVYTEDHPLGPRDHSTAKPLDQNSGWGSV